MRKIYSLILFLACALLAMAQTHSSADKLFQAGDYTAAQEQYGKLLRSYPREALYLYRYARCAQELGDYPTALQYFDKAGDRYMLKYFYLGEIYLQQWHAEAAIEAYNKYLSSLTEPSEREPYVAQQIARAEKLQRYLRRVERVAVIDSVLVPLHQMLLQCSLSLEAGRLQYDSLGGIEFTNQRGDHRLWSQLVDSSQVLLSSHRLLDTWTTPDTLPATINFTVCQKSPYLLNDGVTLYFAAQDSSGLGGLDIYISRYNTTTELYTAPENLGFPYNSPANEYMFILDENQGVGYLATDRFAPQGYVHIYSWAIPEQRQYCRGMAPDSLAAYAQLRAFAKAELEAPEETIESVVSEKEVLEVPHDAISFVINDSVIYTSVDDFLSQEARQLFIEWERLEKQLIKEHNKLDELRLQYMHAEGAERDTIAPQILQLEGDLVLLQERLVVLPREIRQLETPKITPKSLERLEL